MDPKFLCGMIEGFYGRPWTQPQRIELFQNMESWKLNAYMYAPKDDRKHRAAWRELYDEQEIKNLSTLIQKCSASSVQFIYAISPGLDLVYSSNEDLNALKNKIKQVMDLGCSYVAVLFDDIDINKPMTAQDSRIFNTYAEAQCYIANSLSEFVSSNTKSSTRIFFCPTEYCGMMASPTVSTSQYLITVGQKLNENIEFFWTGPQIISTEISVESIRELSSVIRRKPIIWDNIHANDYDMRRVYLGPYSGRNSALKEVVNGILSNANCEYEANFIPFHTLAAYANGDNYHPREAFLAACKDWVSYFVDPTSQPDEKITLEDVMLIGDLFYLPHQHGDSVVEFLKDYEYLLKYPVSAANWNDKCDKCLKLNSRIQIAFSKLTKINRRELLYSLYGYLWDINQQTELIEKYLQWKKEGSSTPFTYKVFVPKIWRGGVLQELHDLLIMDEEYGNYRTKFEQPGPYVIRPAILPQDEDGAYEVCLKTGNSGDDGTPYYKDPKVLARRYVGPYLHFSPQLSFVLEDKIGVCGYVLGVVDSKAFYDRYLNEWIPKMKQIYPNVPENDGKHRDHDIIQEFHNPDVALPDEFAPYPSHLHIDLIPRAQGQGFGKKMIMTLEAQLRAMGSKGVHLGMAINNDRAYHFYMKMGFKEILKTEDTLYLGKKFV